MKSELPKDFYHLTIDECCSLFNVSLQKGLSSDAAKQRLAEFGPNELQEAPKASIWTSIAEQFNDHLVQILLGAAVVSLALALFDAYEGATPFSAGTFVEPATIVVILVANAAVGIVQERNAAAAIDALKSYTPSFAKVLRDGSVSSSRISSTQVVPGDVVEVAAGDRISADCRVARIISSCLRVDQALLTGESAAVAKSTLPIELAAALIHEQTNMVFAGSVVTTGHAHLLVCRTGAQTQMGAVHAAISHVAAPRSPLRTRLDEFGDSLAKIIAAVCIAVWAICIGRFGDAAYGGWFRGALFHFKLSVALAVAAIPEGLAVVITTAFALGSRRMARRQAFVRTLAAVETLGCTSVICADKTGTLTSNQMVASVFAYVDDAADDRALKQGTAAAAAAAFEINTISIEGDGYNPFGVVKDAAGMLIEKPCAIFPVELAAYVASLCNTAGVALIGDGEGEKSPTNSHSRFVPMGDATEAALKTLAERFESTDDAFNRRLKRLDVAARLNAVSTHFKEAVFDVLHTLDFDRSRKSMSVLVRQKATPHALQLLVKGAPESVLGRATHCVTAQGKSVRLDADLRAALLAKVAAFGAEKALRVLALAFKGIEGDAAEIATQSPENFAAVESGLTFVGLVGIADPPRPEVAAAVEQCARAGIRVIVVTGDAEHTAHAVCRQVGIFSPDDCLEEVAFSGRQLQLLQGAARIDALKRAKLFYRVEPRHKSDIVHALMHESTPPHVVAMTGDGVNDAPALHAAHIGVAMGSGTDVAKLAADIVLADDNFATIVWAVAEGRSIYSNIQQFIRYLISSNIGEVVCVAAAALLGLPEVLSPVQLLWVNLVTDGLPATALSFNPPDRLAMRQRPRPRDAPIVGPFARLRFVVVGTYVGVATVAAFVWSLCGSLSRSVWGWNLFSASAAAHTKASSVALTTLVVVELFNALNALSDVASVFAHFPWRNPFLMAAVAASVVLHLCVLHVAPLARLMNVVPLGSGDWRCVLLLSMPVVLIDEAFKWVARSSLGCAAADKQEPEQKTASCAHKKKTE